VSNDAFSASETLVATAMAMRYAGTIMSDVVSPDTCPPTIEAPVRLRRLSHRIL
jgi:hypothetical protein